jgi:valyl-tRNA synthetase
MNMDDALSAVTPEQRSLPDRWIRSRFGKTLRTVNEQISEYRLDLATKALYEFTWNEYCDWYLELTKPVLQGSDTAAARQAATRRTLIEVLEALLRTLHPIVPFITEEIWQRVAPAAGISGETIMLQPLANPDEFPTDESAEQELEWVTGFILGIRQIRGEMDIPPGKPLPVLVQSPSPSDATRVEQHGLFLQQLARIETIEMLQAGSEPPAAATALLGGMKIFVPMAGLIDVDAERKRLLKRRDTLQTELDKIRAKLANQSFVERAPADVVAKQQQRHDDLSRDILQLDEQLDKLAALAE